MPPTLNQNHSELDPSSLKLSTGREASHLIKTGIAEQLKVMRSGIEPQELYLLHVLSLHGPSMVLRSPRAWCTHLPWILCSQLYMQLHSEDPRIANEVRGLITASEATLGLWQALFKNNKWNKGWFHPNRMSVHLHHKDRCHPSSKVPASLQSSKCKSSHFCQALK